MRRKLGWIVVAFSFIVCTSSVSGWESETVPQWIWHPLHRAGNVPNMNCFFRRTMRLPQAKQAAVAIAADDHYELFVNGERIGEGNSTQGVSTFDVTKLFVAGDNVVSVRVENKNGATAGLVARIIVVDMDDQVQIAVSNDRWKTSLSSGALWMSSSFSDSRWEAAKQLGPFANFVALQRATTAKKIAQQQQLVEQQQQMLQKQQQLAEQQAQEQLQQTQLARELQQQQEKLVKQIQAQQQKQRQLANQIQVQQQQLAEQRRAQVEHEHQLMLAKQRTRDLKQQAEQATAEVASEPIDSLGAAKSTPTETATPQKPQDSPITAIANQPTSPGLVPAPEPLQVASGDDTSGSKTSAAPADPRPLTRQPKSADLKVPREFRVQQLAGHADVGSLSAITFDEQERLIVGREDGQLWRLTDEDQDGAIDTRQNHGKLTDSCQGLLAHEDALFISGLGPNGLGVYRLTDQDQDGVLDTIKSVLKFSGKHQEHGPHGITWGPDGKIYVMVGNHCQLPITKEPAAGPYRHTYEGDLIRPRFEDPGGHANGIKAPGGFVIRMDTNGNHVEIVAGGLRNAYDLAFNSSGELFAHDSDMESDLSTTWYRPTRLYHIIDGAEFGWRSGWAKWPEYYLDSLPSIADTSRGSPTGMVVYHHNAFPESYQNTIFSADWTNGQVDVITTDINGASYHAEATPFLRGTPLNATDLEVGPDGSLYVVTGGRGTAGNIYRVSWKGHQANASPPTPDINTALKQPQLYSSWARANLQRVKQNMGSEWSSALEQAIRDVVRPPTERVQALQIMQWLEPSPNVALLGELTNDEHVDVRRMATYLLGLHEHRTTTQPLLERLSDQDAIVRRRACEAIARRNQQVDPTRLTTAITSTDRFESWAARLVLENAPPNQWHEALLTTQDQRLFLEASVAALRATPNPELAQQIVARSITLMEGFLNDKSFVDLLRVQQLALIRGQLDGDQVSKLREWLPEEYPSGSDRINRELIRLLVYLQADSISDRYVSQLDADQAVAESIHLAMHLTFLKSNWNTDQKLKIFEHLTTPPNAGQSLPGYLESAAHQFSETLTDEELLIALANGPKNPEMAFAALLRMPKQLTEKQFKAIQQLDQDLVKKDDESFRRLKIAIVAALATDGQDPSTAYLRTIYDRDPHRRVEVAISMSHTEDAENWSYLIRSLPMIENDDAKHVLNKLKQFRKWPKDAEAYRQVIMVADRLQQKGALDAIALLEYWQGYAPSNGQLPWQDGITAWKNWYQSTFPDEPMPTIAVSNRRNKWDAATLLKHLERADREDTGSPAQGMQVFVKARCVDCHHVSDYGESMGPDLTGISKRFLKREVLDSVLYPSKVISDQYAAKTVATTEGKTYTGIVADGNGEIVILQANGQKVRVPQDQIDETEPSHLSAMPEGLLDDLSLEEITDLFAFLLSDPERIADLRDKAEIR